MKMGGIPILQMSLAVQSIGLETNYLYSVRKSVFPFAKALYGCHWQRWKESQLLELCYVFFTSDFLVKFRVRLHFYVSFLYFKY